MACSPIDPQQFCLTGRDSSLKLYDLRKSNIATSSLAPPSLPIDTETNPNMAAYNESGSELAVSYDFLSYTDKKIYIFQSSANPSTAPIGVILLTKRSLLYEINASGVAQLQGQSRAVLV